MRTTRILGAVVALPALTTALLIPFSTPAAAAPVVPATTQMITGDCEAAPDLPTVTGPTRVEVDRQVGDTAHNQGFADASQLAAGAYTKTRTDTAHPNPERCTTESGFTNALHVLAAPGGPATGTPVTVVATISLDGELDNSLDYTKPSDALSEVDAEVHVEDPNAICNEGCADPLVYRAGADRRVYHYAGSGLRWETGSEWSTSTPDAYDDGDVYDFGTRCATFGCPGGIPGEYAGGLPAYDIGIGTKVVEFPTYVGAVLRVRGFVRTWAAASYGTTSATSDALHQLKASFAPGTSGVELHVGQRSAPPLDTTAPAVTYAADAAPNSNGWNNTDVNVTLTATDNTAVTAFTYTLDGGASQPVPASGVIPITQDGVHNISWAAQDAGGNTTQDSRTVKIDKQDPSLTVPMFGVSAPAGPSGTATVNFVTPVSDALSGASVGCIPASGSTFVLGETTVVCTAVDGAGNDTSKQFVVTVTQPTTVAGYIAKLRELITLNPMDEILRRQLLNDLVLLEKAYEKGRGATKGCKELGDLQLRVTTATSIQSGTKQVILARAGELGELLGC